METNYFLTHDDKNGYIINWLPNGGNDNPINKHVLYESLFVKDKPTRQMENKMIRKMKEMKKIGPSVQSVFAGVALLLAFSSTVIGQTIKYPYNFVYTGNPLARTTGASDPSVHVWDDTVWMYTSQDHAPGYLAMDGYHVYSSADLVHWTDYGDVFNSSMLNKSSWGEKTQKGWMWAPGAARKKNAKNEWVYYLYYPHNYEPIGSSKQNWVTGVATAPNPRGPFTDHGILGGFPQIKAAMDPMVFIDDDGQAYIYANGVKVSKLSDDMLSLAEPPKVINYTVGNPGVLNSGNQSFAEGSYMHKRGNVYYYSYSNFHNPTTQAFYATGTNPYGPFTWKGAFAPKPDGAQDHHSVIEFKGNWYYFYHVAVKNFPQIRDGQSRIACFDNLYYNSDGTIKMVVETMTQKTGIQSADHNLIHNAKLSRCFPNPFNHQTTIKYHLSKPSSINLTIYNSLGIEVTTLVDQHQKSGNYSSIWNGTNAKGVKVSAGVYFYTLKTDGDVATDKLYFVNSK